MGDNSATATIPEPDTLPDRDPAPTGANTAPDDVDSAGDPPQDDPDSLTLPPPTYHGGRKGIPLKTIIDKRKRGLSYKEIAASAGCSKQSIWERLRPYERQLPGVQARKGQEADLFRLTAWNAMSFLTPSKLQKASPYHLSLISGIMHDHALKAEGRYSGDGDLIQINLSLDEVRAKRAALLAAAPALEDSAAQPQAAQPSAQGGPGEAQAPTPEGERGDPRPRCLYPPPGTDAQRGSALHSQRGVPLLPQKGASLLPQGRPDDGDGGTDGRS